MKTKLSLCFLSYLRFFARLQLQKVKLLNPDLKIVGITGSAGKTSTVLACEAALKPNFKIKTTSGSNSETGIPLNILGLKAGDYSFLDWLRLAILAPIQLFLYWPKFNLYLVEMGVDAATPPKNMDFLLSVIEPDIGIFLNVSPVHLQGFSSLSEIAAEKAKLINTSKIAIINPVDPLVVKYSKNPNTISLKPIDIKLKRYLLPDIYQTSFGAAVALAQALGVDQKTAVSNIRRYFYLPPSRASVLKGINNSTIIDSSYNSSPLACQEMLKFLSTFKSPKIAVLGDMREIGPNSSKYHQEIYQTASKIADVLISVGPETQKAFGPKAVKFLYWWQAADYLKLHLPSDSTILVKGSQNTIYLEELVKSLLLNSKDARLLCRQSPYWLKVKYSFRKLKIENS
jgi:UDP-N-acetylmuramoyl-tripeptide--D-alanyl-D-alanine ligase